MVSFQVSAAGSARGFRFAVPEAGVLLAGSRHRELSQEVCHQAILAEVFTTGSSKYFTMPHNGQAPHRNTSQRHQVGVEYFVDTHERSSAFQPGSLAAFSRRRSI